MKIAPDPRSGMTNFQSGLLRLLRVQRLNGLPVMNSPHILAVQIGGMGDFLLAVPALRALKRGIPGSRLDLLTSPKGLRAAKGCPHIDEIESLDIQTFRSSGGVSLIGWSEVLSLIRRVRQRRYDLAVNLIGHYSPKGAVRMGILLKLLGIPLLAGRDTLGTGTFYHLSLPEDLETPQNERDANLKLVSLFGVELKTDPDLEVWPSEADKQNADNLVNDLAGNGPIVGINPGSDRPEKEWPESCFLEVMRALRNEFGARLMLTGGPADVALMGRMAAEMGENTLNTSGKISFQGTAELLRKMDLFLTTDTAALHLAWAVGVPTVALFKQENLGRYKPSSENILCLTASETDSHSPLKIPVEEVIRACRKHLKKSTQSRRAGSFR